MRVFCPSCSEPINVPDDLAGKTTNCPQCQAAFTAPPLFSSTVSTPLPTPAPLMSNSPAAANPVSSVSPIPPPPAPLPPLPPLPTPDKDLGDRPTGIRSIGF